MHIKKGSMGKAGLWLLPCAFLVVFSFSLVSKPIGGPAGTVLLARASPLFQSASDGQALFDQKCKACHTIGGGKLVGPDLQGVTQQRDLAWLKSFIAAPDKLIAAGDPTASELVAQFGIKMPNLGLTSAQVDALVAYLENPAAAGPPQPQNAAVLGDPNKGQMLFAGQVALTNGGPPCNACHTVSGVGAFGGGNLGPNLTHVLQRLGGQPGMASALSSLPFPTMQPIFGTRLLTANEQADLLAFFVRADSQPQVPLNQPVNWVMLILGGVGLLVLLAVMGIFWPRQRRSISDILRQEA